MRKVKLIVLIGIDDVNDVNGYISVLTNQEQEQGKAKTKWEFFAKKYFSVYIVQRQNTLTHVCRETSILTILHCHYYYYCFSEL